MSESAAADPRHDHRRAERPRVRPLRRRRRRHRRQLAGQPDLLLPARRASSEMLPGPHAGAARSSASTTCPGCTRSATRGTTTGSGPRRTCTSPTTAWSGWSARCVGRLGARRHAGAARPGDDLRDRDRLPARRRGRAALSAAQDRPTRLSDEQRRRRSGPPARGRAGRRRPRRGCPGSRRPRRQPGPGPARSSSQVSGQDSRRARQRPGHRSQSAAAAADHEQPRSAGAPAPGDRKPPNDTPKAEERRSARPDRADESESRVSP